MSKLRHCQPINMLLLAHLMGCSIVLQAVVYRRLLAVVVCNAALVRAGGLPGVHAGDRAHGLSGGRHCTAGQYGYVPLGRHLVFFLQFTLRNEICYG